MICFLCTVRSKWAFLSFIPSFAGRKKTTAFFCYGWIQTLYYSDSGSLLFLIITFNQSPLQFLFDFPGFKFRCSSVCVCVLLAVSTVTCPPAAGSSHPSLSLMGPLGSSISFGSCSSSSVVLSPRGGGQCLTANLISADVTPFQYPSFQWWGMFTRTTHHLNALH